MNAILHEGNCEGSYKSITDGKIYQYRADYRGGESISWSASVTWGAREALSRVGSISHNILSGHSLQELVRAHVVASIQAALGEQV
ncbi:hypothetical protein [Herbaspirillum sp. YR522]|uniref:hypothetical protein n=1 Tax=Herbaspirillum sp. YR522 TaxID=1144342 RepID=UPI00026F5C34|nr:hypothetical protein [Herbaspirillum sp. YR522]EJN09311.1 hypothetical protein PMI40_00757 [Herbaspirillum sp. YR522]